MMPPTPRIQRARGSSLALGLMLLASLGLAPQAHALKVATWNLIDYPANNMLGRAPHIRTVMTALDPDVIILQELKMDGDTAFVNQVLNVIQPGQWAKGTYINTAESCVFYKLAKVNLTFAGSGLGNSGPRDVYAARMKLPGYVSREAEFRLYSVHFKAGTPLASTTDSMTRRLECADLRTQLNNVPLGSVTRHGLLGGDTNFYGTWEGGYARLTESQADNDGQLFDPFNLPGTWNSFGYRQYHTQSTCNSGCPGNWSTGGLDDRFDLFLSSSSLQDGEGLDIAPGGWRIFGNDAQHYNDSVNGGGFNNDVGLTVATALLNASDHLPVMLTLQAPAKIVAASQIDFGRAIVGGVVSSALGVGNPALAPADELTYSLTAPTGFTAPAGTFTANAGAAANSHSIGMNTSTPSLLNGALTVANDDPDSTAKPVQLSGIVLAHAVGSVDSMGVSQAATLDFGLHTAGNFMDRDVCLFNDGWTSLQSKLEVTGGAITGGAGRFSIAGGFTPAEVAGGRQCYSIHFDDTGATIDSSYEATLTFSASDEVLPGSLASPNLVVTLRATPSTTNVGAPRLLPDRVAFLAPRPNPSRGRFDLGFELPSAAPVALEVFDLSGRRVAGVLQGLQSAGRHTVRWTPRDDAGATLDAGLYFVRFTTAGRSATRRLVLLP